jgi:hypothetical protein
MSWLLPTALALATLAPPGAEAHSMPQMAMSASFTLQAHFLEKQLTLTRFEM